MKHTFHRMVFGGWTVSRVRDEKCKKIDCRERDLDFLMGFFPNEIFPLHKVPVDAVAKLVALFQDTDILSYVFLLIPKLNFTFRPSGAPFDVLKPLKWESPLSSPCCPTQRSHQGNRETPQWNGRGTHEMISSMLSSAARSASSPRPQSTVDPSTLAAYPLLLLRQCRRCLFVSGRGTYEAALQDRRR